MKSGKKYNGRFSVLPPAFYERNTLAVTRELMGKYLIRQDRKNRWIGRIVEAEAYIGETDPACHASRGLTPRTKIMYGQPGHAYVYFTYGMYFMFNVTTERPGFPAAVLIRALEPILGFDLKSDSRPASGPGKLCRSMRIDKTLNGVSLISPPLWIAENHEEEMELVVRWSPRIGINVGTEKFWRAYVFGNPFVSRRSDPSDPLGPDNHGEHGEKQGT